MDFAIRYHVRRRHGQDGFSGKGRGDGACNGLVRRRTRRTGGFWMTLAFPVIATCIVLGGMMCLARIEELDVGEFSNIEKTVSARLLSNNFYEDLQGKSSGGGLSQTDSGRGERWPTEYCRGMPAGAYMPPGTNDCSSALICFGDGMGYFLGCKVEMDKSVHQVSFVNGEYICGKTCAAAAATPLQQGNTSMEEPERESRMLQTVIGGGDCASVDYTKVNFESANRVCSDEQNGTLCCKTVEDVFYRQVVVLYPVLMGRAAIDRTLMAACISGFKNAVTDASAGGFGASLCTFFSVDAYQLAENFTCINNTETSVDAELGIRGMLRGVCDSLENRCMCYDKMRNFIPFMEGNNSWGQAVYSSCVQFLAKRLLTANPANILGLYNMDNCVSASAFAKACPISFSDANLTLARTSCSKNTTDITCCTNLLEIDRDAALTEPKGSSLAALNRSLESACQSHVEGLVSPGAPLSEACPAYFNSQWSWLTGNDTCTANETYIEEQLQSFSLNGTCHSDLDQCQTCGNAVKRLASTVAGQNAVPDACLKTVVRLLLKSDPASVAGLTQLNWTACNAQDVAPSSLASPSSAAAISSSASPSSMAPKSSAASPSSTAPPFSQPEEAGSMTRLRDSLFVLKSPEINWGSVNAVCSWTGVACDTLSRISELKIKGIALGGTLSADLGGLIYLETLVLQEAGIRGTIPAEIGNLRKLRTLDVSSNLLTGPIPPSIVNCTQLTSVNVSNNKMSGPVPNSVSRLASNFSHGGEAMNLCSLDSGSDLKKCSAKSSGLEWPIILMIVLAVAAVLVVMCAILTYIYLNRKDKGVQDRQPPARNSTGSMESRTEPNNTSHVPAGQTAEWATVAPFIPNQILPSASSTITTIPTSSGPPVFVGNAAVPSGPPKLPPWHNKRVPQGDDRPSPPDGPSTLPPLPAPPLNTDEHQRPLFPQMLPGQQVSSSGPRPGSEGAVGGRGMGVGVAAGQGAGGAGAGVGAGRGGIGGRIIPVPPPHVLVAGPSAGPGPSAGLRTVPVFAEKEILNATNKFSRNNIVGKGTHGRVYRAELSGKLYAVKKYDQGATAAARFDEVVFLNYADKLNKLSHPNLVRLHGACYTASDQMIVYQFMDGGNLFEHLQSRKIPVLPWKARLDIAIAAAKGLVYMHEQVTPQALHGDLKSSNIFVQRPSPAVMARNPAAAANCSAVVGDYGILMENFEDGQTMTMTITMNQGNGYADPDFFGTQFYSVLRDVHNFGIILLEIVTGRRPYDSASRPQDLGAWARENLGQGQLRVDVITDPRLLALESSPPAPQVVSMVNLALKCIQLPSTSRPRMSQVLSSLQEIAVSSVIETYDRDMPMPTIVFDTNSGPFGDVLPR